MVPYHRFLLSLLLLDITNQERLDTLAYTNCNGVTEPILRSLARDLAKKVQGDELVKHLNAVSEGKRSPSYVCHKHAAGFIIKQGLTNIMDAMQNPSQSAETQAFALVTRRQVWRVCATLFLAGEKPEEVAEAVATRFRKQYSNAVYIQAYFMFFQFGSMREHEITKWVNTHTGEDLRLLRIAINEPSFMVRDQMMLNGNIKPEHVFNRIMTRSYVRFEEMSISGHDKAMQHAREWAKLAIKSGKEYERVSSGGFNDFLSLFNIALQEATENIIDAHTGEEFFEETRSTEDE